MAGGSRSAKTDWAPETSPSIDSRIVAIDARVTATETTGHTTVAHAAPTTFVTQFVFDDTGTTGGLYAWTGGAGGAYVKVGLATT